MNLSKNSRIVKIAFPYSCDIPKKLTIGILLWHFFWNLFIKAPARFLSYYLIVAPVFWLDLRFCGKSDYFHKPIPCPKIFKVRITPLKIGIVLLLGYFWPITLKVVGMIILGVIVAVLWTSLLYFGTHAITKVLKEFNTWYLNFHKKTCVIELENDEQVSEQE